MDTRKDKEYIEAYTSFIGSFCDLKNVPIKELINFNGDNRQFSPAHIGSIDNLYLLHNLYLWRVIPIYFESSYGFVIANNIEDAVNMIKKNNKIDLDQFELEVHNCWKIFQKGIQQILGYQFWSNDRLDDRVVDTVVYKSDKK